MSFETTLVCDGCSSVLSGGGELEMVRQLLTDGGRAFTREYGPVWVEVTGNGTVSSRHLCADCVQRKVSKFYDGSAVPW